MTLRYNSLDLQGNGEISLPLVMSLVVRLTCTSGDCMFRGLEKMTFDLPVNDDLCYHLYSTVNRIRINTLHYIRLYDYQGL